MRIVIFFLCFFLVGCVGDHRDRQEVSFDAGPKWATKPESLPPAEVLSPAELNHALANVREEHLQSNNALQQSMTSAVGLSIGKMAEKFDASLARVDATMQAKFDLIANTQTEIKSSIGLAAQLSAVANAVVDMKATFNARMEALASAQAQAGLNNTQQVEKINETIKAGGNVTQFPKEVKDVMIAMQNTQVKAQEENSRDLKIVAGIIMALIGASHAHTHSKLKPRKKEDQSHG